MPEHLLRLRQVLFYTQGKEKAHTVYKRCGLSLGLALSYFSNTTVVTERAGRAKASLLVPLSVFAKSLSLSVT